MRHSTPLLRLFASAILVLVAAEPTDKAAGTECEPKRRSCTAECRAQHFSIDPKRNACIAKCVAEANKCMREQAHGKGIYKALAHPARRAMCPVYATGLIGPGERKNVQPTAERLGLPAHDALHHFVAADT